MFLIYLHEEAESVTDTFSYQCHRVRNNPRAPAYLGIIRIDNLNVPRTAYDVDIRSTIGRYSQRYTILQFRSLLDANKSIKLDRMHFSKDNYDHFFIEFKFQGTVETMQTVNFKYNEKISNWFVDNTDSAIGSPQRSSGYPPEILWRSSSDPSGIS